MTRRTVNILICAAIVLLGGVVTVAVVVARRSPDVDRVHTPKVTNIEIEVLETTTVHDTFTVTGSLDPWLEVQLSSEATGKIEWLGVEEGEIINAGSELLRVDRSSAEIRYKQALTELAMASLELDRITKLRDRGIGSAQNFDKAKVERDAAQSNLNSRETELASTSVIAPFNGFVDEVLQEKDEFVNVGTPLFELIQIHDLKMIVGITDQDVSFFSIGDPVTVVVDAYPDRSFFGTIHRIGLRADSATHTFETEIELDNQMGLLKPGMIARAVLIRKRYPDSITIPIFSVLTDGDQKYVFLERDGTAVKTPISILLHQGNVAVVRDGLDSEDRLIVAGHRNLRDGSLVSVRDARP